MRGRNSRLRWIFDRSLVKSPFDQRILSSFCSWEVGLGKAWAVLGRSRVQRAFSWKESQIHTFWSYLPYLSNCLSIIHTTIKRHLQKVLCLVQGSWDYRLSQDGALHIDVCPALRKLLGCCTKSSQDVPIRDLPNVCRPLLTAHLCFARWMLSRSANK